MKMKGGVTELVPGKRASGGCWTPFQLQRDEREWTGAEIRFDIARKRDQTEVCFAHLGLVPAYECFDVCSSAWSSYINGSVRRLIATGTGKPNPKE
jgi:hypothetical protein